MLARQMGVTRQAVYHWMKYGLSKEAKNELVANASFRFIRMTYIITYDHKEYAVGPSFWGELKGLKELRASVKLLKAKERKSK